MPSRMLLLLCFILLDYLVTLSLISHPIQEANIFARASMEIFGIPLGLTLFTILTNMPLYLILYLFESSMINRHISTSQIANSGIEAAFAWFIAGAHFNGATSWFWGAPDLSRQSIGAAVYMLVILMVRKKLK